jgi:signal transduction histidine kinase
LQDIFKQKLSAKNLQFTYDIAPDVPLNLQGDNLLLRQILMNLVGNSIKFTEQGEIQVQVQAEELTMNRIRLFFSIVDTGVGIPTNKIDTILEPFSQADNSLQRKYQGTGLGLSIVKSLVEMMDGNIDIESTEGRGTKVNISIVLKTSPPTTPASFIGNLAQ